MNVLITGGTGFIGTNVRDHLYKKTNLFCVSTSADNKDFIKVNKNFEDISLKLKDISVDIIVHTAAAIPSKFEQSNFENIFLANAYMMENLKKLCEQKKVKKFIYISGYGTIYKQGSSELVKDYYTLSKIYGEQICSILETSGIQTASLRIPSPYGAHLSAKSVINMFIDKAIKNETINVFGTGKREQNFIYIKDVLQAIELCINSPEPLSGIYDIVSKQNTTMLELATIIKELVHSRSTITVGEFEDAQENFKPEYNYNRALRELGYKPEYDINKGLKEYIDWYVSNR